jgi:hypothetical protein
MKNFAIFIATALLSACSAGAVSPTTTASTARVASIMSSSVYTLHFVIPVTGAQTAIFDPCTNPAIVINGTGNGKYEFNEQFGSAGHIEFFHYQENSVFTSTDGLYTGRNSVGSPGIVNYVDGLAVASGHSTFKLNGPTGTLQIQETSHFTFAPNGTPSITGTELKVLCGANRAA